MIGLNVFSLWQAQGLNILQKKSVSPIIFIVALLGLSACSSTNFPKDPGVEYAASFASKNNTETAKISATWWSEFNSPELNQLLQTAEANSPDIQISRERVRQAQYQLAIANASWFPQIGLGASTGENRSKASGADAVNRQSTSANLTVNYELDLWGGVAATRRAAQQNSAAANFTQVAAQLSIKAAIAKGWFECLALQARIATAQQNIDIAQRIFQVVESRYKNGVATAAEVAQQQTNLLSLQSQLLPLQLQARQAQIALAILVGANSQDFSLPMVELKKIAVPEVALAIPSELVLRRPDLAASEANLLAADADIVAARASLFPSMSLGASAGVSSSQLFALNPATQVSNWSVSLAQTLFNGGRLINQKRLSESRRAELLVQYRKDILVALQEVDVAIASAESYAQQEQQQLAIVVQAERSLRLSEATYSAGGTDLLSLLSAQRSLFQAQDDLVQKHLARLSSAVDLYKALGGGWSRSTLAE